MGALFLLSVLWTASLVQGVLQLNNGEFTKVNPLGPFPGQATSVPSGGNVYFLSENSGITTKYSPLDNSWTQLSVLNQNLTYSDIESSAGVLFAFGGQNGSGSFNDIYFHSVQKPEFGWQLLEDDSTIPPRYAHSMNIIGGVVYIFGGWDQTQYFADTWWFDTSALYLTTGTNWTYSTTPIQPPARNSHSMVTYGGALWLFGGFSHNVSEGAFISCAGQYDNCQYYGDLWTYIASADKWIQVFPSGITPPGRAYHVASIVGENMYVFGGMTGPSTYVNDLWAYNLPLGVWRQLSPKGPVPAPGSISTSSIVGGTVYFYGGVGGLYAYNPHVNPDTTETSESTDTTGITAAIVLNILLAAAIAVVVILNYRAISRDQTYFSEYAPMKEGAKV